MKRVKTRKTPKWRSEFQVSEDFKQQFLKHICAFLRFLVIRTITEADLDEILSAKETLNTNNAASEESNEKARRAAKLAEVFSEFTPEIQPPGYAHIFHTLRLFTLALYSEMDPRAEALYENALEVLAKKRWSVVDPFDVSRVLRKHSIRLCEFRSALHTLIWRKQVNWAIEMHKKLLVRIFVVVVCTTRCKQRISPANSILSIFLFIRRVSMER